MEQETEYRKHQVEEYKRGLAPLLRFLPWLEQKTGKSVSHTYEGTGDQNQLLHFPVYDGTLISFVKSAQKSPFMDKNYRYVYTRNRIVSHEKERLIIEQADWKDWGVLCGILSKYVLGGQTRALLWSEAMEEQIFYLVIKKMKDIIEYWDKTPGI